MASIISVRDVRKVFTNGLVKKVRVVALDSVSVDFEEGEITAILGINGAGKSTLIKCILGLLRPTSGHITVAGRPVDSRGLDIPVGYLPENFQVPKGFKAREILSSLGLFSGLTKSECQRRCVEVLEQVGLTGKEEFSASEYSKGMAVRLGIAQALLHSPSILILDEPTDGLDPLGKVLVRNLLLSLVKEGKTILLNSHLLSEIELVAHNVVILHEGKIVKAGKLADLLPSQFQYRVLLPQHIELPAPWQCEFRDGVWSCTVRSTDELQQLLAILHQQNCTPMNVVPERMTLEDVFLTTVTTLGMQERN